jgi:alkylated DNA nucleotide flippase Atl1
MTAQEKFQYLLIAEVGVGKIMTAHKLARLSGVSHATIGNVVKGLPSNIYNMQRILDALGYEILIQKKQTNETGN